MICPIKYVIHTADLKLSVFNMITKTNESKTLIKYISSEWKCKIDERKCNFNQNRNTDKCRCQCKNPKEHNAFKKDYIWNPNTCSFENAEYLTSNIDDSVITCDEVINAGDAGSKLCQQMLWVLCQQILIEWIVIFWI